MKTIYTLALGMLLYFSTPTMGQVVFHTQNEYKNGKEFTYVTAENFQNVVAAQFSMSWPKEKLQFKDIRWNEKLALGDQNFNLNRAKDGMLMFVWVDSKLQPKFFRPCDTLLVLEFRRLQGGEAKVKVTDEPTAIEIVSSNNEILNYRVENGIACGVTDSERPNASQSLTADIFPNPMGDEAVISLSQSINGTLLITGHDGKRVREEQFSGSKYVLERKGLNSGLYILQIIEGDPIIHREKIIIE